MITTVATENDKFYVACGINTAVNVAFTTFSAGASLMLVNVS
jgi:hypothetical protein